MEFVQGTSLREILNKQGPLQESEIRALWQRLASGLSIVHAKGLFHGDISPNNILVPDLDFRRAKLIDFGVSLDRANETIRPSDLMANFAYASPEQLLGGKIDAATDVFSLGLVLAHMAIGTPLARSVYGVAELSTSIPSELRRDIQPLLEFDPARRPRISVHTLSAGTDAATNERSQQSSEYRTRSLNHTTTVAARVDSNQPRITDFPLGLGRDRRHPILHAAGWGILFASLLAAAFLLLRTNSKHSNPSPESALDKDKKSTATEPANRTTRTKPPVRSRDTKALGQPSPLTYPVPPPQSIESPTVADVSEKTASVVSIK